MKKILLTFLCAGLIFSASAQGIRNDSLPAPKTGQAKIIESIVPGRQYKIRQKEGLDVCIKVTRVDEYNIYGEVTIQNPGTMGKDIDPGLLKNPNGFIRLNNIREIKERIHPGGMAGQFDYWSLAYEHEAGGGPANGLSIGYTGNPDGKRKYYLGVRTTVLSSNERSSSLEYTLMAISMDFTQRLFVGRSTKALPFIDFDLGYRMVSNEAERPIVYGAPVTTGLFGGLGFRYSSGGANTDRKELQAFSAGVGVGCFLNVLGYKGLFIKLGYKVADTFQLIDKNSLGSTGNNTSPDYSLGYNTYTTRPVFVTLGVGLLIGVTHEKNRVPYFDY